MTPTLSGSVEPSDPPPPPPPATVPPQAATRSVTPASSPALARMRPPLTVDQVEEPYEGDVTSVSFLRTQGNGPFRCVRTQPPTGPFTVPSGPQRARHRRIRGDGVRGDGASRRSRRRSGGSRG